MYSPPKKNTIFFKLEGIESHAYSNPTLPVGKFAGICSLMSSYLQSEIKRSGDSNNRSDRSSCVFNCCECSSSRVVKPEISPATCCQTWRNGSI